MATRTPVDDHDEPSVSSPLLAAPSPVVASHRDNGATRSGSHDNGGGNGGNGGDGDDPAGVTVTVTHPPPPSSSSSLLTYTLLGTIWLISLNESFTENVLWPFLPFMVTGFGYSETELGVYVGILSSSYFVAQLISSYVWGRLADRIGRRPTILAGCLGATVSILIFGFSSSFAMALFGRILSGLMNGNLGIIKAYIAEITDSSNRVRGFTAFQLSWSIGGILAPCIGGFLSHPEEYGWFSSSSSVWHIFVTYPFALPCVITAVVGTLAFILGLFALPETPHFLAWRARRDELEQSGTVATSTIAPAKKTQRQGDDGTDGNDNSNDSHGNSSGNSNGNGAITPSMLDPDAPTPSLWQLLQYRDVLVSTTSYGLACMIWAFFDETFALVCKTSTYLGGFAMTVSQIGIALAICGAAMIVAQVWAFDVQNRRIGSVAIFQIGIWLSIIFFITFPLLSVTKVHASTATFWSFMSLSMILRGYINGTFYLGVVLCMNNSIPSHLAGAVNGIGQSLCALGRAIGPITGGVLWSVSTTVTSFALHAWILYTVIALLAFACYIWSRRLPSYLTIPWKERTK